MTPQPGQSEHLSRDVHRDHITKRLPQVSGCVAGSRTDLDAPSARERPASSRPRRRACRDARARRGRANRQQARRRMRSICAARSGVHASRIHCNRPGQLSHRPRGLSPVRPARLLRNRPRQLDDAHRTRPTDQSHQRMRLRASTAATRLAEASELAGAKRYGRGAASRRTYGTCASVPVGRGDACRKRVPGSAC